jgi:hypothetical protein
MEFFSAMDQTTKQFLLSETEINWGICCN